MKYTKQILLFFLTLGIFFIISSPAYAVPTWLMRIEITITPQMPESYEGTPEEFRANPTYLQGEEAVFNVQFWYRISRWWSGTRIPIDIPERYLYASFPNSKTPVNLNHIGRGLYNYRSPVLRKAGYRNHTLRVVLKYTMRYRIWNRWINIPVPGNIAQTSISVARRPLNIEITSPIDGAILNTNPLHVEGTVDDNNAEVTVNGLPAAVAENHFSVDVPVAEGENIITAHAENEFGTTDTDTITVTIDTIAPQNLSINIDEGAYTNTTTINLTLSAEGADEMIISEDPGFLGAVWETYVEAKTFTLSEGDASKTIYVKFRDAAHNETPPVSDSITLDTTLPQIEVLSPLNGSITSQNQANVSGTFTEVNLDTITVNGISALIEENTFIVEGILLDIEGNNLIRIEAVDLARNSNIYEINVIRDTLPPEIQISNPTNNFLANQFQIDITGTFTEVNPDTITVNGVAAVIDGNTFTAEGVQLNNEGDNPIRAVITDLAGQTNSHEINIIRDTTPPQNPSIAINEGDYTNSTAVNLTLSADEAAAMIISETPDFSGAEWEPYVPARVLTLTPGDGSKTIYAKFRDEIQNETLPVSDVTILDQTPPQLTITTPLGGALTNQAEITVTGTYIEANLNAITVNDITAITADGVFTLEGFVLVEGDNTVTILATDLASNTDSETIQITLDSIPPQNPSVLIEEGNQTDVRLIHLLLLADGATGIIISESEDFSGANWEPYVERKEYTLSEGEGLKRIYVKFRDMAGNETSVLQTNIILGHLISITSPQDGLTINAIDIAVIGVVNGEDIQVYINGLQAKIVDNTFYINQFPLQEGTNTITAHAYSRDELLEEAVVNVLTEELTDPVQVTANPLSGEPGLEVSFSATTNIPNSITNYAWDFDNDGRMDWESIDTGDTSHTYNQVRLYHPTIRLTDTNGTQYADTVTINIYLPRTLAWAIDIEDPIDLAVDGERNLYILQRTSSQIQKYDMNGDHISTIGGIDQFNNPSGIAIDQSGNIYIADTGNNRIQRLTSLGEPDNTFNEDGVIGINIDNDVDGILDPGTEPSQFNQPYGIGVDGEGNTYITDTGNNRVQKFNSVGEFLLQWEVNSPYGIAVDLLGDIHIADRNNNGVQIYSSMGSSLGTYTEGLSLPTDTALSSSYLYIVDTGNNLIRKINRENLISDSNIDTFANGEEVDSLSSPVAIALDNDPQREFVYIADSGNNRVVKIELRVISPTVTLDAMKAELSSGDIHGATEYFTEDSRERYQEIFNLIRDNLPEAISDMNDVHPITIQDNYAEYIMVREEDGEEYGYFITLAKDENGEWRIQEF